MLLVWDQKRLLVVVQAAGKRPVSVCCLRGWRRGRDRPRPTVDAFARDRVEKGVEISPLPAEGRKKIAGLLLLSPMISNLRVNWC